MAKEQKHIKHVSFKDAKPRVSLDTGFVHLTRKIAKNTYHDGTTSREYPCDIVIRRGIDAVAIIPYYVKDNRFHVVLRRCFRPVAYYAETILHERSLSDETRNFIEVAAGVLEEEDGEGEAGVRECARRELEEETGYVLDVNEIEILNAPYYASPGIYTERIFICAACVDNAKTVEHPETDGSVMEEVNEVLHIPLTDALRFCDDGAIQNAITEIAVRRLARTLETAHHRTLKNEVEAILANPYHDESGAPYAENEHEVLAIIRERVAQNEMVKKVSEKRFTRMSHEMKRLRKENTYYNRLVREFRANISHELKHPIANILGYANLLRKDDIPPEAREKGLTVIRDNAQKMSEISKNLISVALTPEEEALESGTFNPAEEIAEVIAEHTFLYDPSHVFVSVSVASSCHHLVGVRERFRLILEGVISNALKFTEEGEVSVSLAPAGNVEHGTIDFSPDLFNHHLTRGLHLAIIEVVVQDTGVGIAKSKLRNVFKPFYQEDSRFKREYGGMGLGLYVVKNLITVMQGTIKVESVKNEGTTVRMQIPLGMVPNKNA